MRARTTIATNGKQNATWPITIGPRLSGQGRPVGQPVRTKNASSATPMQISGITIGSAIAPSSAGLPGKRKRHSASARSAPITVLIAVAISAMAMLLANASIRDALCQALA